MASHQVQFYENDDFLIEVLSNYIGTALTLGDQAIVIATRQHLEQLKNSLCELGVLERKPRSTQQRYIELDAHSMLPQYMSDGLPDRNRFHEVIGGLIASATAHPGHVYVFGEMVAILSAGELYPPGPLGRHEAAIRVERYFNELQQKHRFTLLCAYPLNAFPKNEDHASFQHICNLHSEVSPARIGSHHASLNTLQRTIASLQQKANALANEMHDRNIQEAAQAHMALSEDLDCALSAGQLEVFYQPIVELASGQTTMAEALLRWHHPVNGEISPEDFIPIAEHRGLITPIGEWVFNQALRQAQRCRVYNPQFTVSVNMSPIQFLDCNEGQFNSWIAQCRHSSHTGEPARAAVNLEITENLMLDATPAVRNLLTNFRDAGIQILLDNFGTGYSSLSCLGRFNLDYLKIDRSLVFNPHRGETDIVLCQAIIAMAHKLNLKVIAEGVETIRQKELLHNAGADFAQGSLFSLPVPGHELEALIKNAK